MALKLENEFVVDAGLEATWAMLLDLSRVSDCLPGATIEPGEADGVYRGTMRVKLGPVTVDYAGTAQLEEADEASRTSVVLVEGKETRGQGTASARIRSRLAPEGASTRVVVETELNVTGRPAQFGRGIMEDVAAQVLTEFAARLSRLLQQPDEPVASSPSPPPLAVVPPPPVPAPAELDLTDAVRGAVGTRAKTAAAAALGIVVAATVLKRLRRR